MRLFRQGYTVSTNRVRDRIRVKENGKTLELTVNEESGNLVHGINKAQQKLSETVNKPETAADAAQFFAAVIFGQEQAGRLMDFYGGDPFSVVEVCVKYLRERLGAMITRNQKKQK